MERNETFKLQAFALTAANGPNCERKEEKSRSCTAEVPSAARDTASSTWTGTKELKMQKGRYHIGRYHIQRQCLWGNQGYQGENKQVYKPTNQPNFKAIDNYFTIYLSVNKEIWLELSSDRELWSAGQNSALLIL